MDSVIVSDYFQFWCYQGGYVLFLLFWMIVVGECINWLLLGILVLIFIFCYNFVVIVQVFVIMGCLYLNCVFFGVGIGEVLNEIVIGYEGVWLEFKEWFVWLCELVGLMWQLWSGDCVDFDGDYYWFKGVLIYDVFDGGVFVYIVVGGLVVVKYVGCVGDGFICMFGKGEEFYIEKLMLVV